MSFTWKDGVSEFVCLYLSGCRHQHVLDFDTATRNLLQAVQELQATWSGGGYQTFTIAMDKWNGDMNIVGADLANLADTVQKCDVGFQSVDTDITKAFQPFAQGGSSSAPASLPGTRPAPSHQPFANF